MARTSASPPCYAVMLFLYIYIKWRISVTSALKSFNEDIPIDHNILFATVRNHEHKGGGSFEPYYQPAEDRNILCMSTSSSSFANLIITITK